MSFPMWIRHVEVAICPPPVHAYQYRVGCGRYEAKRAFIVNCLGAMLSVCAWSYVFMALEIYPSFALPYDWPIRFFGHMMPQLPRILCGFSALWTLKPSLAQLHPLAYAVASAYRFLILFLHGRKFWHLLPGLGFEGYSIFALICCLAMINALTCGSAMHCWYSLYRWIRDRQLRREMLGPVGSH
ncbi:unnamed protein product, partial [Mesorhabditis spiculigera]